MNYQEFDPPIGPGDEGYIPPGSNLTASAGGVEGDCPAVTTEGYSYVCTLDRGHDGPHIAHGTEWVDGKYVDLMYARWDDDTQE